MVGVLVDYENHVYNQSVNQKPFFYKYVQFESLAPVTANDFNIEAGVLDCKKQSRISFGDVKAAYGTNYRTADFSENAIMILTPSSILNILNPMDLTELCLQKNQIEFIHPNTFASLVNLEKLDLSHNCISHLSRSVFVKCPQLVDLNLSHNQIDYVRTSLFACLKKLRTLRLNNNTISLLAKTTFANQSELQFLDLSHNKLHDIKADFFQHLSKLQMIMLNDNLIYFVQNNSFRGCTNLQMVCLHANRISFLDDKVLRGFRDLLHKPMTVTLYENNGFYIDNRTYKKSNCVEILNASDINQMNAFLKSNLFEIVEKNLSEKQIVKLFLAYYIFLVI